MKTVRNHTERDVKVSVASSGHQIHMQITTAAIGVVKAVVRPFVQLRVSPGGHTINQARHVVARGDRDGVGRLQIADYGNVVHAVVAGLGVGARVDHQHVRPIVTGPPGAVHTIRRRAAHCSGHIDVRVTRQLQKKQ